MSEASDPTLSPPIDAASPETAPQDMVLPAEQAVAADPLPGVAALSAERLPPNFRKHVDPAAPVPIRGMAAKGLVPLAPSDMCHCLAMLAGDPDPSIAASALKTGAGLPDKILSVGLRDEGQNPRVLDFFAGVLTGKDGALEYIVLNNAAHDLTIARIVGATSSTRIIEIVAGNQLRILREEQVLRALLGNPSASRAIIDTTCDFAVRSGLVLSDIPAMVEAHVRINGAPPAPPESPEALEAKANTAEALIEEFGAILTDQEAGSEPLEEGKRLNLTQRIAKMNVSEKVKLATLGNKEARTILLREPNKLVQLAVINSPRITDAEVLGLAQSKTTSDDVLRVIMGSREWTRQHQVKLALVKNPKVPMAVAMRFMSTLRDAEVRELAKNKNIPSGVRLHAKKMTEKKGPHGG
ncbi:MAG: hypothetical protein ACOX6T_08365 [Myxococcales bacterium]|jgi:hypothetical protein